MQSESHVEDRGSDEDAEYDSGDAPDASALRLGSCLGETEPEAQVSEERFVDSHSSLIFDAALKPLWSLSGAGMGARRLSASRSCSLRSFMGGSKPRSRSAASRFSREVKELGSV